VNLTVPRYPNFLIIVHWLTAALILIAYFLSEGGPGVRLDPPRWHFITGMAVLLLVLPRVIVRLFIQVPSPNPADPGWLVRSARLGHLLLYLLLVAVPLTGWYAMSRLGVSLSILGYSLPPLAHAVQGPRGLVADLHQIGGNAILILAGIHGAAALWHHFVRRDDTMRKMRPW
jgi:cytochrome b561